MTDIQDQLLTMEKCLAQAEQDGDEKKLLDIISPDFEGVNSHGSKINRDLLLDAFTSGDLKIEKLDIEDVSVRIFSNVALILGSSEFKGSFQDKPIGGIARFMDIWMSNKQDWKLIASQVTPIQNFE